MTNKKLLKKLVEEEIKRILSESSLSRVQQHIENHDCALISASRFDPFDATLCASDEPLGALEPGLSAKVANKTRTKQLRSALLYLRFGVTSVDGSFVENFDTPNAVEVLEDSFFVVNLKDDPEFQSKIEELGKKFCQDSIVIIPKGGENAFSIGTNKLSLGTKTDIGSVSYGHDDQFMTKTRNRPFTIKEKSLDCFYKHGHLGKLSIYTEAKQVLKNI